MRLLPWNRDVAATVAALRSLSPPAAEVQAAASAIVEDVRARGDDAVRDHTRRLDRVDLAADYAVPAPQMAERLGALPEELRAALETAAANIRAYHEREAVPSWRETLAQGQVVGQTAEQGHGQMGVGVDQSGHDDAAGCVDGQVCRGRHVRCGGFKGPDDPAPDTDPSL